ncbi:hypothetical protein CMQ_8087 [Grosmannia clavigera kw1407]|uniref:Uncharacterized protein n=1 Tax=Grosmannia clavigera (strain kw1407 / UAMH 11150) TaxID=655863 RepID=F0XKZ4_GROCL|nr:uncharacterized protein CMQ_8087 [Grosmannia clavigera kw1407]EFX01621.1 hypothetical protein CMQ_8087 [Grosmannia clavigera kw1407]
MLRKHRHGEDRERTDSLGRQASAGLGGIRGGARTKPRARLFGVRGEGFLDPSLQHVLRGGEQMEKAPRSSGSNDTSQFSGVRKQKLRRSRLTANVSRDGQSAVRLQHKHVGNIRIIHPLASEVSKYESRRHRSEALRACAQSALRDRLPSSSHPSSPARPSDRSHAWRSGDKTLQPH